MSASSPLQLASVIAPERQAFRPGSVIAGKYRVDGELGVGGMGVVLSARHLDLDAPVAIKVMRDDLAGNEEVVARMLFEARAAAQMRGAHIVRVLDVARLESGAPYIVMERLEGRDLATELTQRGTLSVEQAVDYILQACEGLAEAHAVGIVHRDLKPENLFLAEVPEGQLLKILDFGISKDLGSKARPTPRSLMTSAGCSVGSPYYMSPEQMRGSEVDGRADIWSLGAILHELVTGACPFDGESIPVLCSNVLNKEPAALPPVKLEGLEQLQAIIHRCLRKDADQRFQSVTELADSLRELRDALERGSGDRGLRLASGLDFKREPVRAGAGTPVTLMSRSAACSSPTLPVPVSVVAEPGRSAITRDPELASPWRTVIWIAAGAALVALGTTAIWQHRLASTPATEKLSSGDAPASQLGAEALPHRQQQPVSLAATPASMVTSLAPAPVGSPATTASAAPPRPQPQRWTRGYVPRARAAAHATTTQVAPAAPVAVEASVSSFPAATTRGSSPPVAQPPRSAWEGDRLGGRY